MSTVVETQERGSTWQHEVATLARQVGPPMAAAVAVLIVVGAGVGLLITNVFDGPVVGFDLDVSRTLVAHRTSALNRLTAAATVPADSIAVAVLWISAMAIAWWRTRSLQLPVFLLCAIGGEKLSYLLTTFIVRRPRPPVEPLGHVFATSSFPSGHVGSAITLYGGVTIAILCHDAVTRGRWRPLGVRVAAGALVAAFAVLVGFSRMYRGHHFLTDVLWGAVLGVVWLMLGWHLVLRKRT